MMKIMDRFGAQDGHHVYASQMQHQNVGTPQATPTREANTPEKGHGKIRGYSWINVSLGVSRQYLVKNGPSSRRQAVDGGHKWSCAPRPGDWSSETSFCKMETYETNND